MLDLAVKAMIPVVSVSTRDTINANTVIEYVVDKKTCKQGSVATPVPKALYVQIEPDKPPARPACSKLLSVGSTLVMVNPKSTADYVTHVGELPVPQVLKRSVVSRVVDEGRTEQIMRSLGGLTLKETSDVLQLTLARDGEVTTSGTLHSRRDLFQDSNGLYQVTLDGSFYIPTPDLVDWVEREGEFFLYSQDPRMIPRGLLFDGMPGVGKTEGAKYLARTLGVPLYRLDVGSAKNKYVGESERRLSTALAQLDDEQPCVVLLDEVEKVFASSMSDSSGTTSTMMSQLLWWLAEHESRVLTVMTTNDRRKIPPELYREGRVDDTMVLAGLDLEAAMEFAGVFLSTFDEYGVHVGEDELLGAIGQLPYSEGGEMSHASVVKAATCLVKRKLTEENTDD